MIMTEGRHREKRCKQHYSKVFVLAISQIKQICFRSQLCLVISLVLYKLFYTENLFLAKFFCPFSDKADTTITMTDENLCNLMQGTLNPQTVSF